MRRILVAALFGVGLLCLLWVAVLSLRQSAFQREQEQVLQKAIAAPPTSTPMPPAPVPPPRERLARAALVGRLEIPRVKLSAIVSEGDDDETLKNAIGHLPDTVLPWEAGNSALAAHRDTFFRPLKDVQIGDELTLTSPRGVLAYRVSDVFITSPSDVGILLPHGRNELTLVTCYPFGFVGNAPKRYIVRAERIEPQADQLVAATR